MGDPLKGCQPAAPSCLGPWAWRWALWAGPWELRGGTSLGRSAPASHQHIIARGPQGSPGAVCPAPPGKRGPLTEQGRERTLCHRAARCPLGVRSQVQLSAGLCTCISQGRMQARCCNKQAQVQQLNSAHTCVSPRGHHGCSWAALASVGTCSVQASASVAPSSLSPVYPASVGPGSGEPGSPHWQGTQPHGPTYLQGRLGNWVQAEREPVRRSRGRGLRASAHREEAGVRIEGAGGPVMAACSVRWAVGGLRAGAPALIRC